MDITYWYFVTGIFYTITLLTSFSYFDDEPLILNAISILWITVIIALWPIFFIVGIFVTIERRYYGN